MSKSASTSSNSETSLASLDTPGKGLRNDPKSEGGGGGGGGGVFRLDALAPGAAGSGADPFAAPKPKLSQSLIFFLLLVIPAARSSSSCVRSALAPWRHSPR